MSYHANGLAVLVGSLLLISACSKLTVGKVASNEGRLENGTKAADTKPDRDERNRDADGERADPPVVIAGTHLVCDVVRDPNSPQATTQCALREDRTENKVDLNNYRSHQWQATVPELSTVTSTSRELPADSTWHWELVLKAGTLTQLDAAIEGTTVTLSLRGGNSRNESMATSIADRSPNNPRWMSLNGSRLPPNAIEGGTEHLGRDLLSICRIYDRGGVFPGKLEPHAANPDRSLCSSTRDGEAIRSQSDDGRTMTNKSDVLMPGSLPWADVMEWTGIMPPMNIPKNAFVGGVDDRGEALYVCRGLESGPPADMNDKPNDPTGEWTPGYVKASTGYCQHEYYGQKNSVAFQILVWKQP